MGRIEFLDLKAMNAELADELNEVWVRTLRSGQFVGGASVDRFEQEWANYCGTGTCVGVSDGTAALELTLRAFGIGRGDEVIVPANTFVATWGAVVAAGARPVGVDVDPHTLLMTAEGVAAAIGRRTAAVIVVHLFGNPADMDAINAVARRKGLVVIEDAAQAHGASYKGRRAGGLSDAGCFSFYPGKNLGAFGDAGAVVTSDAGLAARIRSLSNHGRHAENGQLHILKGGNRRLDSLQAGILSVKLARLDAWNMARRRIALQYRKLLDGMPVKQVDIIEAAVSSHHLAPVLVSHRDRVRNALSAADIATGTHYAIPCHLQPAYGEYRGGRFPVAERAAKRLLSLPMHPHLGRAHVQRVVSSLELALKGQPISAVHDTRARSHDLQRGPGLVAGAP